MPPRKLLCRKVSKGYSKGMKILGLTGGMGMGKSTVATLLQRAGLPVFDADAEVRRLQADHGAALPAIAQLVPHAVQNGHLDRAVLRQAVIKQPALLKKLEHIIHPMVRAARAQFLRTKRLQARAAWCWIFRCYMKQAPSVNVIMCLWYLPHIGYRRGAWPKGGACHRLRRAS